MELLKDVCRLCLSVGHNMERLFDIEEIKSKISSTLKVELFTQRHNKLEMQYNQILTRSSYMANSTAGPVYIGNELFDIIVVRKLLQAECLPEGICDTCRAIINHIHNFHQKVIQSQDILNQKLTEGTDSLRDFLCTLKDIKDNIKNENIDDFDNTTEDEDDNLKLDEIKYIENKHEIEIEFNNTSSEVLGRKTSVKTVTHKSKSMRRKKKIEEEISYNVLNDTMDIKVEEETCSSVKQEKSDVDIDLAIKSASEDDDWTPQINIKKSAPARKRLNRVDTKNSKIKKIKLKANKNDEISRTADKNDTSAIKTNTEGENYSSPHPWKCLTCFEMYPNRKLLSDHFNTKHKPKMIASQDLNRKNYSVIEENGMKMYKCGYCGKVRNKIKYISSHISCVHNKLRPYICNMCGRRYQNIKNIVAHNRAHGGGEQIFCSYSCGYNSAYRAAVKEHEMSKHRGEFKYKCECGKKFNVRTWYEDHQNEHKGIKPYVCRLCKQAYHYDKQLKEHTRKAHSKQDDTPTEECSFTCTLCAQGFNSKSALTYHLFEEHGIHQQEHLCDSCGKSFKNKKLLRSHERCVHTSLRPYTCRTCNMTFKLGSHLNRHELGHLKKRPPGRRRPGRTPAPSTT